MRTLTLLFLLGLNSFVAAVQAQEVVEHHLACPLTSALSKNQVSANSTNTDFTFKGETVIRRVAVSIKSNAKWVTIPFTWTPQDSKWGVARGTMKVRADQKTHCFFLNYQAAIPANVDVKSFKLIPPVGTTITQVAFSEKPSDRKMVTCPKKEFLAQVEKAYDASITHEKDRKRFLTFLNRFKKLLPTYDCRRPYDSLPIPALWLADHAQVKKWLDYVSETKWAEGQQVFGSKLLQSTLDGELAESYLQKSIDTQKRLSTSKK